MDRLRVGFEPCHAVALQPIFFSAQLFHPGFALVSAVTDAAADSLGHGAQDRPDIPDQPQGDVAILADGAVIHVDLYHRGVLAQSPAIAHAEVERGADDDDHIGLVESIAASLLKMMRVARRQRAAAGAVHKGRNIQVLNESQGRIRAPASPDLRPQ